jgi:hypothetical protein
MSGLGNGADAAKRTRKWTLLAVCLTTFMQLT